MNMDYGNLLKANERLKQEAEAQGLYKPWAPQPIGKDEVFTAKDETWVLIQRLKRRMLRENARS